MMNTRNIRRKNDARLCFPEIVNRSDFAVFRKHILFTCPFQNDQSHIIQLFCTRCEGVNIFKDFLAKFGSWNVFI